MTNEVAMRFEGSRQGRVALGLNWSPSAVAILVWSRL